MAKTDKRIDAYIAKAAPFAQPILKHLRSQVHKACPGAEETLKWGFPHFMYHDAILCSMASFKQHCSFGFWKAPLMKDYDKLFSSVGETAMGHFGKMSKLSDLPSDKVLISYIKEAAKLNEEGVSIKKKPVTASKKELKIPSYFTAALKKNKKAQTTFENFSYSYKKDYIEWITEAKTEETRNKRMATTLEWLSEGKGRNWKYER